MKVITAPNEDYSVENQRNVKLFLAGGITNCWKWQDELIKKLYNQYDHINLSVYNPRRENFPINDPNAAEEQIVWEYNKLKQSDIISFWFAEGSPNPIVLFELGAWMSSNKVIKIGVEEGYERRFDVKTQLDLYNSDINIKSDLDKLVYSIFSSYEEVAYNKGLIMI